MMSTTEFSSFADRSQGSFLKAHATAIINKNLENSSAMKMSKVGNLNIATMCLDLRLSPDFPVNFSYRVLR